MNRVWTLTMVIAILMQITDLHELYKLPVLFEHYSEHQQRNANVSFTDFLSMHYFGQDLDDNDDNRDMQLPFKKLDIHPVHHHFTPPITGVKLKSAVFRIALNYPGYLPSYTLNPLLSAPFRPPRA